jgi:peptidoglycan/xylan/chitin deacetylase (PgdA/CDA1 family)
MTTRHVPLPIAGLLLALTLAACGSSSSSPTTARDVTAATSFPTQTANGPTTATTPAAPVAVSSKLITHGPRTRKAVALTFDADMTKEMLADLRSGRQKTWIDHRLFDELDATHTHATIFLTGLWTKEYPAFVRQLARNPQQYELENHSYDHLAWTSQCYGLPAVRTKAEKRAEVVDAQKEIAKVAGVHTTYFRFPGGCQNRGNRKIVGALGQKPLQWDVVSGDPANPDTQAIVNQVLTEVKPGSIVIAHCIGAPNAPQTAAAFAQIIPALKAKGYDLVTLDELFKG